MKTITIDRCGECPNNKFNLFSVKNYCKLMEMKQILDAREIPEWCPLEDK
jgi:hypothetical protein